MADFACGTYKTYGLYLRIGILPTLSTHAQPHTPPLSDSLIASTINRYPKAHHVHHTVRTQIIRRAWTSGLPFLLRSGIFFLLFSSRGLTFCPIIRVLAVLTFLPSYLPFHRNAKRPTSSSARSLHSAAYFTA